LVFTRACRAFFRKITTASHSRLTIAKTIGSKGNIMDSKLLQILVCPVTKGPLIYNKANNELISKAARLAYPVRDGIPVMLEDEARKLEEKEYLED
jgi:uncharacterized protein YbaR (Trm112 family)